MNYLSVCSGIEAATVAWHDIGWNPVGFSEIELFPSAVLSHHYPDVANFGDMTKFKEWNLEPNGVDLLVGGTPCQSFSVAGLRKGLDDPRGNLALTYCSMLDHFRPTWFIWENVPGVLSSSGGRDFGSFLGAVAELGYGFAYRVLDAQYFGVAQRRRRVFVVGYLGNWQRAAAVLFERESLCRDTAPSREAWKETAGAARTGLIGGVDYENNAHRFDEPTGPLLKGSPTGGGRPLPAIVTAARMVAFGVGTDCYNGSITGDVACTMGTPGSNSNASGPTFMQPVTYDRQSSGEYGTAQVASTMSARDYKSATDLVAQPVVAPSLTASNDPSRSPQSSEVTQQVAAVHAASMEVRRLTPVECERLQGFPDNYTNIPWRKKDESPDGPRYKALGNSMAVPVMRWIGERINQVKEIV